MRIGNGRRLDIHTAAKFEESTHWDGNNYISDATGSQWEHETLYLSRRGTWVLHAYSQWQGSAETWDVIPSQDAHEWLIDHGADDDLPGCATQEQRAAFSAAFRDAEV